MSGSRDELSLAIRSKLLKSHIVTALGGTTALTRSHPNSPCPGHAASWLAGIVSPRGLPARVWRRATVRPSRICLDPADHIQGRPWEALEQSSPPLWIIPILLLLKIPHYFDPAPLMPSSILSESLCHPSKSSRSHGSRGGAPDACLPLTDFPVCPPP